MAPHHDATERSAGRSRAQMPKPPQQAADLAQNHVRRAACCQCAQDASTSSPQRPCGRAPRPGALAMPRAHVGAPTAPMRQMRSRRPQRPSRPSSQTITHAWLSILSGKSRGGRSRHRSVALLQRCIELVVIFGDQFDVGFILDWGHRSLQRIVELLERLRSILSGD